MLTKLEIKRIELFSLFKVAFFLYAAIGLVVGLFYGFFMMAASFFSEAFLEDSFPELGFLGGVLGLVLIPVIAVFYGAVGSVFVTIVGVLYNLFAGLVGGVRLETQVEVAEAAPATEAAADSQPPTI